jgi:hypothetical protein
MTFRLSFLLLLMGCVSSRPEVVDGWIGFSYFPGWVSTGQIKGTIFPNGRADVTLVRRRDNKEIRFQKQLRPHEIGLIEQAVRDFRKTPGNDRLGAGVSDTGELKISVRSESGDLYLSMSSAFMECSRYSDYERLYRLWNAIVTSVSAREHDTREYIFHCTGRPNSALQRTWPAARTHRESYTSSRAGHAAEREIR